MTSAKVTALGFLSNISPQLTATRFLWGCAMAFATTYVLFQKKLLPFPLMKLASKLLFLPTFPITALMRIGNYWTPVDETLILGCAPMGFMQHPEKLHALGVRGVVNLCYEYEGPTGSYTKLGIKQLYLPNIDHYEVPVDDLKDAVAFIKEHQKRGEKVYVHCKAGHGRAASVALSWLISENLSTSAKVYSQIVYVCSESLNSC
jgi:atypical dual specificity phosphatase